MANISAATAPIYEPFSIRHATRRCGSFALMGYAAKGLLEQAYGYLVSLYFNSPSLSELLGFNPPAAALFFLGLTIFHWGQGDRYISVQVHQATYLSRSKVLSALHILSRGSIPILLPGYLGNDTYRNVIEALVSSGGQASYQAEWVSSYPWFFS